MININNNIINLSKKVGFTILTLVLALSLFAGCSKTAEKQKVNMSDDAVYIVEEDINFDDDIEIISNTATKANMSTVILGGEDYGRSDPFLPSGITGEKMNLGYGIDLEPPPETITVDTEATEIITTKVSGILYDEMNPSSILNIGGTDYLVRTGDVINGYKVLSIAKNYVAVQYGANIYKAGVGELFNAGEIKHNTVSNLENKFGGNKERY